MALIFDGLASFAGFITGRLLRRMPMMSHHALEQAGMIIENEAKRVLGTYDYGWPPLAADTIDHKATGDSPGLETGEMRDSITHHVTVNDATGEGHVWVGTDHERALWFELGTRRQPPRPFLSIAAARMAPIVRDLIGARAHAFLSTGEIGVRADEFSGDRKWTDDTR